MVTLLFISRQAHKNWLCFYSWFSVRQRQVYIWDFSLDYVQASCSGKGSPFKLLVIACHISKPTFSLVMKSRLSLWLQSLQQPLPLPEPRNRATFCLPNTVSVPNATVWATSKYALNASKESLCQWFCRSNSAIVWMALSLPLIWVLESSLLLITTKICRTERVHEENAHFSYLPPITWLFPQINLPRGLEINFCWGKSIPSNGKQFPICLSQFLGCHFDFSNECQIDFVWQIHSLELNRFHPNVKSICLQRLFTIPTGSLQPIELIKGMLLQLLQ